MVLVVCIPLYNGKLTPVLYRDKYTFAAAAELTFCAYCVANFVLEVPRKYVMYNCPLCLLIVYAAYVEGDLRLVGGTSAGEGRVEVYLNGEWGTVCDDNWDINDATVACQQLGHLRAVSALGGSYFGEGSDPIWYDNVDCVGNETNIAQCSHSGIGLHNCNHSQDAGVICGGKL